MEVVQSPSPFGRVLKDHNLRERRPPTPSAAAAATSKSQPNLQKTLKELVREHLRSSISASNENSIKTNRSPNSRKTQNSKTSSDSSSVSSLVQKWRGLQTHNPPKQELPNPVTSDTQIQIPVLPESDNDSVSDWDSDQALMNHCPPGSHGNGVREKIRVIDIMKKLPLVKPLGQSECREVRSPRIRGRQAAAEVLARLAHKRYEEVDEILSQLTPVSKFRKRGLLQSCLKYKLLKGPELANGHRLHKEPKSHEFSKQRVSSVKSLRRRFSRGPSEQNDLDCTKSSQLETTLVSSDSVEEKKASTLNQPSTPAEATKESSQEPIPLCKISDETLEVNHQEENCIKTTNQHQVEVYARDRMVVKSENKNQQTEKKENFDTAGSSDSTAMVLQDTGSHADAEDHPYETPTSKMVWQESGSDEEASYYGSPAKTDPCDNNVWEEEEMVVEDEEYYYDNDDFFESGLDWTRNISRPHSYWESQRQARHQELESSANDDIQKLIKSESVSGVLRSAFRNRMEQVMIQLQKQPPIESREDEDRFRVAFLQNQMQSLSGCVEEEEEQNQDHEQEGATTEEEMIENGDMVSAVLASAFRDRMEQVMIQLQKHPIESHEDEGRFQVAFLENQMQSSGGGVEEEEQQNQDHEQEVAISEEDMNESGDLAEEHEEPISEEDMNDNGDMVEEREEAISEEDVDENGGMEEEHEECNDEQTQLMELPWSIYQDRKERDDIEPIESATCRRQSYDDHNSQLGSSIKNHSTIDTELICDIRAHMQQIYSEMSELRKAVNSCMEMQSKFQNSIREEVSAAISHSKGKESKRRVPKKGSCCICHKKKADSLLYRCGHMCTCFECANELQWSSGKCPICWAEIADVVRVCTDDYY